jgi:hypothetical protein
MNTTYVYDSIFLSAEDLNFYKSLTTRNQILFLYDLCLEVEPQNDIDNIDEIKEPGCFLNNNLIKSLSIESKNEIYVHVIILQDLIIFAANLEDSLQKTKNIFYNDGFIFMKSKDIILQNHKDIVTLCNFFKIVEIYDLLSITIPISLN